MLKFPYEKVEKEISRMFANIRCDEKRRLAKIDTKGTKIFLCLYYFFTQLLTDAEAGKATSGGRKFK